MRVAVGLLGSHRFLHQLSTSVTRGLLQPAMPLIQPMRAHNNDDTEASGGPADFGLLPLTTDCSAHAGSFRCPSAESCFGIERLEGFHPSHIECQWKITEDQLNADDFFHRHEFKTPK